MVVFLESALTDIDGKDISTADGKPATVRGVVVEALLASYQDEQNLSGDEKMRRWELAVKVKKSIDPAEFSIEEVLLMKQLVGKAYAPLVVGQTWRVLEGGK